MIVAREVEKLYSRYREGKLAHAFLLETNRIEACYQDVLMLIKMLNCAGEFSIDCESECNLCKLIEQLSLPSLIVINPEGLSIKKSQVIELKNRFATKPVYAKFNTYIINQCDKLNGASANTMLKFLEEPADDIIGFFITDNKENVISTIKSRCQILKVVYEEDESEIVDAVFVANINLMLKEDYAVSYLERKKFVEEIGDRKGLMNQFGKLLTLVVAYNKYLYGKEEYVASFNEYFFKSITLRNISGVIELHKKVLLMLRNNVNIDLVLDLFVFEMRDLCA